MKFKWYCKDKLGTEIEVDYKTKTVKSVTNHTDYFLDKAFGNNDNPTWEDWERFLESRCFSRNVDDLKLYLEAVGVDFYDPLSIVLKTKGKMHGDFYTLLYVEE